MILVTFTFASKLFKIVNRGFELVAMTTRSNSVGNCSISCK